MLPPANGELVCDMWPPYFPRMKNDHRTLAELTSEDHVPEEESELYVWAKVLPNPNPLDRARRWSLLLVTPSADGRRKQVTVTVQGFVDGAKLSMSSLGNWNGKYVSMLPSAYQYNSEPLYVHHRMENAAAARQSLVLHGAEHVDVFQKQSRALQAVANYIKANFQAAENFRFIGNRIEFERPVFKCVCPHLS